jgi:hypothetical protein
VFIILMGLVIMTSDVEKKPVTPGATPARTI